MIFKILFDISIKYLSFILKFESIITTVYLLYRVQAQSIVTKSAKFLLKNSLKFYQNVDQKIVIDNLEISI